MRKYFKLTKSSTDYAIQNGRMIDRLQNNKYVVTAYGGKLPLQSTFVRRLRRKSNLKYVKQYYLKTGDGK